MTDKTPALEALAEKIARLIVEVSGRDPDEILKVDWECHDSSLPEIKAWECNTNLAYHMIDFFQRNPLQPVGGESQKYDYADDALYLSQPIKENPVSAEADPIRYFSDQPIETAKTDGTKYVVWAAEAHGLPAFITIAAYHPEAGWCVDELRPVTHWLYELPNSVSAEPVALLHVTETDEWPDTDIEVLDGSGLQPSMSPIKLYTSPPDQSARIKELVCTAYEAGARAVHENWQEDRDPDFTEAAYDHFASLKESDR